MTSKKLGIVILAALLLGAAPWVLLSDATAQPGGGSTDVLVCDVVEVFNNYERAQDLSEKLERRTQSIDAENKKRTEAIEAIQAELGQLKKDSPEYEKRFMDLQRAQIERKAWLEFQNATALRDHHKLTREMYAEILQTVGEIARSRGAELVLVREKEDVETTTTQDLLRQIERRKVIYHTQSVDVTESVLSRLNAKYRASRQP